MVLAILKTQKNMKKSYALNNNFRMRSFKYLLIGLLVVGSCKSKKVMVDGTAIEKFSAKKIVNNHLSANFKENTVDAKLKVNYKSSKENIGFSVRMKIKKDEVIWLRGSKFISIFRAKITPKKVEFYSPYYKSYFEGDFSVLKKVLGTNINFEQLQNMLLGQSVFDIKQVKQKVEIAEKSYKLSPKKQPNLFDVFFFVNPSHFKLNKQRLVNLSKNQRLDVLYAKYLKKENILFPEKININTKTANKFVNIDILVSSVVFNTALQMPFSIPKGYKKIKL